MCIRDRATPLKLVFAVVAEASGVIVDVASEPPSTMEIKRLVVSEVVA